MSGYRPSGAWLGNSRAGRVIAVAILLLIFGILTKAWVFERYTLTLKVENALVPVNCNRATNGLFRRVAAQRDFEPADSAYSYCGWVRTDHGPFKLPQSNAMAWIQSDRASLAKALQAGCRYTVKVVGTGQRPTKDPALRRKPGTIIRILETLPC